MYTDIRTTNDSKTLDLHCLVNTEGRKTILQQSVMLKHNFLNNYVCERLSNIWKIGSVESNVEIWRSFF